MNLFDFSTKNMKSVIFSHYATKASFFVFHSLIRLCCLICVIYFLGRDKFCNIHVLEMMSENCGRVKEKRNRRSISYFT